MASKTLKKWVQQIKKVKTWDDSRDFEDSFPNDLKCLKSIQDEDAPLVDDVVVVCIVHGNGNVMGLAEKILERRKLGTLDWKNHKGMLRKWFSKLIEYGMIPDTAQDLYSFGGYDKLIENLVNILKANKMKKEFMDDLYHLIVRSMESDDNRLLAPAAEITNEIPWDQKPEWIKECMDKTYKVLQKYPELAKKNLLGELISVTWLLIFTRLMMKVDASRKFVAPVTKMFLFCKDQEWIDAEDTSERTVFHELLQVIMVEYIFRNYSHLDIIKPMLPAVKEIWETVDDPELYEPANNIMSCVVSAGHDLKDDNVADTLLKQYFSGDHPTVIGQFLQMYPQYPNKFNNRIQDFLDHMKGEGWIYTMTLQLLSEIAGNSPESFTKKHIADIATTLQDENTSGVGLRSLSALADSRPKDIVIHDQAIIRCMYTGTMMAILGGPVLVKLSKVSEDKAKLYLKVLKEIIQVSDSMSAGNLLHNMKTIGNQYVQALAEHEEFFQKKKGDPMLTDVCNGILNLIAGRTLEGLSQNVEEQRGDIGKLDKSVSKTKQEVAVIGKAVSETKEDVKGVKKDVKKQEKRLTEVEDVVEETVEKVEEIDKKTLSHAPVWSRDVANLLNPKAAHDWRFLATRLGFKNSDIKNWATQPDPCLSLMDEWFATHKTREATFAVLKALQEMNRTDAAMIVENSLKQVDDVVQDEDFEYATPPPVFISYQWGLQEEVKLLQKHLEMCGFDSWMDIGQMGGGDKLFEKIDKGIRSAEVIICCVSEKYAASPNCNREVNLSVTLGKPVIPLLMEKMSWPPPGSMGPIFGEYLFIRFFAREGESASDERYWPTAKFQELLMQLRYYVAPNYKQVTNSLYKKWWSPLEEVIVISKNKKPANNKSDLNKTKNKSKEDKSPEIFISYQWGKQPQIKKLYKKLTEKGYSCWLDIMQMGGGDSLYDKIDKGVRGCNVVISCVTSKYSLSANCRREVSLADALKKPIIPILLEKITWPPEGPMSMAFTQLIYIDFCDAGAQNNWNTPKIDELLSKINGKISGEIVNENNDDDNLQKDKVVSSSSHNTKPDLESNNQSKNSSEKSDGDEKSSASCILL